MGKKRIQLIDDFQTDDDAAAKKAAKKAKKHDQKTSPVSENEGQAETKTVEPEPIDEAQKTDESPTEASDELTAVKPEAKKAETKSLTAKARYRSKNYRGLLKQVDRNKSYPIAEAIDLLLSLAKTKQDQTVELHLNTIKDKLSGEVTLPHGTGKKQNIAIFNDEVIKGLEAGKMDFDRLLAKPEDMPKLAKYAKLLGPKGLFPNPKNGTITPDPEKAVKELSGGKTYYQTEAKFPIIHLTLGKVSFGKNKLMENLEVFMKAVGPTNISKAVLTSILIVVKILEIQQPNLLL
jgi:large subunit ribosomal protein L1